MRILARVALGAEEAFLLLWLVAEIMSPQASSQATVSDLVHDAPWVITLAFLAHAVALGVLVRLVPRLAQGGAAAASAGMLLVAFAPVGSGQDAWHFVGALLAFGGVAWAAAATARLRRPGRWLGVAVVVSTGLLAASGPLGWFPVMERVQLLVNAVWLVVATGLFKRGQVAGAVHGGSR